MYKILINLAFILGFSAVSLTVLAKPSDAMAGKPIITSKKIACFPITQLLSALRDRYGEEPMLFGITEKNDEVGVGVYINKDIGTYTIIEFTKDAACIISVGKDIQYRYPINALDSN
jgi:hypothetical protein